MRDESTRLDFGSDCCRIWRRGCMSHYYIIIPPGVRHGLRSRPPKRPLSE